MQAKPNYCLTKNRKKMAIVESLDELAMHIAGASVDIVNGEYREGEYLGTLLVRDSFGNIWSGCRVSNSVAALVEANRAKRHKRAFERYRQKYAKVPSELRPIPTSEISK